MEFIIRSTKHFSVDLCHKLFDYLVLSKFEYGHTIWSPQYDVQIKPIKRLQRKCLEYMIYKKFGYLLPVSKL